MRLTILVPDTVVGVEHKFFDNFDMSQVPPEVRVLQWSGTQGELEFYDYRPNEVVTTLPAWAEALYQQWVVVSTQNMLVEPPNSEINKVNAAILLAASDWAVLPDVADPTKANPYLGNQAAFVAYRSQLRAMYTNPPVTPAVYPDAPKAVWVQV